MTAPRTTGEDWQWIGPDRADDLRRRAAGLAATAGALGVVTIVLALLLFALLPASSPLSMFFPLFGLVAAAALFLVGFAMLLARTHVRRGFLNLDGVNRIRAGVTGSNVLSLFGLLGALAFTPSPFKPFALATLPALGLTLVATVLVFVWFRPGRVGG